MSERGPGPKRSLLHTTLLLAATLLATVTSQAQASQALQLATQVNGALSKYIGIHNQIFDTNARHITPIPGIFEKIEFCKVETNLSRQGSELSSTISLIPAARRAETQHSMFLSTLDEFAKALNSTVADLQKISRKLCLKSQGKLNYSVSEYGKDLETYETRVERYVAIGGRLNALLPTIQ